MFRGPDERLAAPCKSCRRIARRRFKPGHPRLDKADSNFKMMIDFPKHRFEILTEGESKVVDVGLSV